jgi:hypothetical protein
MGFRYAVTGLLAASIACTGAVQTQAQDTTVTTKPLALQNFTRSDENGANQVGPGALSMRIKVNINNENLREAIKKIIGKADVTYEFDADVPSDLKVSLKADNIMLSTAINVLTESAGIGCTQSNKHTVTDTNSVRADLKSTHLHFRKALAPPLGQSPSSWLLNIPNVLFDKNQWSDTLNSPYGTINKYFAPNGQPGGTIITPNDANNYSNKLLDTLKVYSPDANAAAPLLYNLKSSEERLTFTCPHCHEQVTIIKKHVAPKCPTCGRLFQDDWKFCPVDGTKRPEDSGEWKFCPHCGKPVP